MTISPALTRSPSRTRSSPTTPPVGCCTFLTFESTTTEPGAISAPESLAVPIQPPTPTARTTKTVKPARTWRRMDCRVAAAGGFKLSAPRVRNHSQRGSRRLSLQYFRKHVVSRTGGDNRPLLHCKKQIDPGDRARSVRDHDHDAAAGAHAENGLGQCRVAFGIQIGIRLVKNNQEGIAIERARERDSLCLSRRQGCSPFANLHPIAIRQGNDHVVDAGGGRCGPYCLGRRIRLEPADVLRHRPAQEFHVLRKISDMAS